MGRLIRLIFLLAVAFVFGVLTERDLASRRCENDGGRAMMGLCFPDGDGVPGQ